MMPNFDLRESANIGALKIRLIGHSTVLLVRTLVEFVLVTVLGILPAIRPMALNGLNREQTCQRSLRQKIKRAAMNNDYMFLVLSSCFADHILGSSEPLCQP